MPWCLFPATLERECFTQMARKKETTKKVGSARCALLSTMSQSWMS